VSDGSPARITASVSLARWSWPGLADHAETRRSDDSTLWRVPAARTVTRPTGTSAASAWVGEQVEIRGRGLTRFRRRTTRASRRVDGDLTGRRVHPPISPARSWVLRADYTGLHDLEIKLGLGYQVGSSPFAFHCKHLRGAPTVTPHR